MKSYNRLLLNNGNGKQVTNSSFIQITYHSVFLFSPQIRNQNTKSTNLMYLFLSSSSMASLSLISRAHLSISYSSLSEVPLAFLLYAGPSFISRALLNISCSSLSEPTSSFPSLLWPLSLSSLGLFSTFPTLLSLNLPLQFLLFYGLTNLQGPPQHFLLLPL